MNMSEELRMETTADPISHQTNTNQSDQTRQPNANDNKASSQVFNNDFRPCSKQFEKLLEKVNSEGLKANRKSKMTLKNFKFARLVKLFRNSVNYYETMLLNNENSNLLDFKRLPKLKLVKYNVDHVSPEVTAQDPPKKFFICDLCSYILREPITLTCGCTYCKSCLDRYNRTQLQHRNYYLNKKRMHAEQALLFKCKKCGQKNPKHTLTYLKTNNCLSDCIAKLFGNYLDLNMLRVDLRNYVCLNKFEIEFVLLLFENAFKLDETNSLLLSDLFLIYYFNDAYEKCAEIVDKIIELVPTWPFAYYMRALCQTTEELAKKDLDRCIELDSNLDRIKYILQNLKFTETSNEPIAQGTLLTKRQHTVSISQTDSNCKNQPSCSKSMKIDETLEKIDSVKTEVPLQAKKPDSASTRKSEETSIDASDLPSRSENLESDGEKEYENCDLQSATTSCVYPKYPEYSNEKAVEDEQKPNTVVAIVESLRLSNDDFKTKLVINTDLITIADVECSLCYRLFYEPITTLCGHVFCAGCLDRSLDHQDRCPLCKSSLSDHLAERRQSITKSIENLIKFCFSDEYEQRKLQHETEVKDLTQNQNEIPIFVCTLALPRITIPLHIFEPRYRLMMRRALSTTKKFGMCMPSDDTEAHYNDSGCLLEIKSAEYLPDGRLILETIGVKRFKVLERSVKDGYDTAKVEWITDTVVEGDNEKKILHKVKEKVYLMSRNWYDNLSAEQKEKIAQFFGTNNLSCENFLQENQDTDNGPKWLWFLISILPIDHEYKLKFLRSNSLLTRLMVIKKVLSELIEAFDREKLLQNNASTSTA